MPLLRQFLYKQTWMRKTSHTDKTELLLIRSMKFSFSKPFQTCRNKSVAQELRHNSLSLQEHILDVREFRNSCVFKTISSWGSTDTDTHRAAWKSQIRPYDFFEIMFVRESKCLQNWMIINNLEARNAIVEIFPYRWKWTKTRPILVRCVNLEFLKAISKMWETNGGTGVKAQ